MDIYNEDEKGRTYKTVAIHQRGHMDMYGYPRVIIKPKSKLKQLFCNHHSMDVVLLKKTSNIYLPLDGERVSKTCMKCGKVMSSRFCKFD